MSASQPPRPNIARYRGASRTFASRGARAYACSIASNAATHAPWLPSGHATLSYTTTWWTAAHRQQPRPHVPPRRVIARKNPASPRPTTRTRMGRSTT